jgi:hypothetical protein
VPEPPEPPEPPVPARRPYHLSVSSFYDDMSSSDFSSFCDDMFSSFYDDMFSSFYFSCAYMSFVYEFPSASI